MRDFGLVHAPARLFGRDDDDRVGNAARDVVAVQERKARDFFVNRLFAQKQTRARDLFKQGFIFRRVRLLKTVSHHAHDGKTVGERGLKRARINTASPARDDDEPRFA